MYVTDESFTQVHPADVQDMPDFQQMPIAKNVKAQAYYSRRARGHFSKQPSHGISKLHPWGSMHQRHWETGGFNGTSWSSCLRQIASRIMNFVIFLALNIRGSTGSSFFLGKCILNESLKYLQVPQPQDQSRDAQLRPCAAAGRDAWSASLRPVHWRHRWGPWVLRGFGNTLWWTNSLLWKITIFNGKIHYFYGHFQ